VFDLACSVQLELKHPPFASRSYVFFGENLFFHVFFFFFFFFFSLLEEEKRKGMIKGGVSDNFNL
jgi:hypothetical protein